MEARKNRRAFRSYAITAVICMASAAACNAESLLQPGDPILAIDALGASAYPDQENPPKLLDGDTGSKYLNFARNGAGFIVIPDTASVLQSFQITTANDDDRRDPATYRLFGFNGTVTSPDNSAGLEEAWSLISAGNLDLPLTRQTAGPFVNLSNTTSYSAYKLYFPTVRDGGANSLQIAEVQFFSEPAGGGSEILNASSNIRAIDHPDSNYPGNEPPASAIDGIKDDAGNKYLNFGREGTGLIVTPTKGLSIVTGLQLTTAGDAISRDPSAFSIFGTNAEILSGDNSTGTDEAWAFIASGALALPDDRNTEGDLVTFPNDATYLSYKIIFTENKGPDSGVDGANSIQVAEIQLEGTVVPEPSTTLLLVSGTLLMTLRRRRR